MAEESYFWMGLNTLKVSMKLHSEIREKVVNSLRDAGLTRAVVVLAGGCQKYRHDTDVEMLFRQESFFHYLFGVSEPNFMGILSFDEQAQQSILFCPPQNELDYIWTGNSHPPSFFTKKYGVDDTQPTTNLNHVILSLVRNEMQTKVLLLEGTNSDSGRAATPCVFPALEELERQGVVDRTILYNVLAECRVVKTIRELEVLEYSSAVTSQAHVSVMQNVLPGMTEYQLESMFLHHIYFHSGCRMTGFTCICGVGPNSSVLHYGHAGAPNSRVIESGDMAVLDMGSEYHAYVSDISCSFPITGIFSRNQILVYEAVLHAVRVVMEQLKAGVDWAEMHRLASRTILSHLISIGILHGCLDDIVRAGLGAMFMPHGLGHLLGKEIHDVGGYLPGQPPRPCDDGPLYGICKLRTARILQENMVVTVEPGLYFIKGLMQQMTNSPKMMEFVNVERLREFENFGGVRIEDIVRITKDGFVNFTLCPRSVEEVEDVMAGKEWPPKLDKNPWLRRCWKVPAACDEN